MAEENGEGAGAPRRDDGARDNSRRSDAVERILRMVSERRITPEEGRLLIEALSERGNTFNLASHLPQIDIEGMGRLGRRLADRMMEAQALLEREAGRVLDPDASQVRTWEGTLSGVTCLDLDVTLTRASLEIAHPRPSDPVDALYRIEYQPGPFSSMTSAVPEVSLTDGRLAVRQTPTLSGFMGNLSFGSVRMDHLRIYLPASVQAIRGYIRSQNGRIELEDLAIDDLDIQAQNGRVEVRTPQAGRLTVNGTNGHVVMVANRAETVRIQTRNGRVALSGDVSDAALSTANGRIDADASLLSQDALWRLHTRNGRISLLVPNPSLGIRAEFRSLNGRASASVQGFELSRLRGGLTGGDWRGQRPAADGAPTLTVDAEAGNGRIVLREAQGEDDETDGSGTHGPDRDAI